MVHQLSYTARPTLTMSQRHNNASTSPCFAETWTMLSLSRASTTQTCWINRTAYFCSSFDVGNWAKLSFGQLGRCVVPNSHQPAQIHCRGRWLTAEFSVQNADQIQLIESLEVDKK